MLRKGNHNIFVGDRAYQTNFFLKFKSPMSEQKFQVDTFLRTKYFLQGYVLTCLCYVIWNFINSTCFNFYHDCKHTTLLIFSLICLIASFPAIQKKNSILIGLLFLAPSLYIHLVLIDTYSYHLAVHFTVVQTTIASALVFHTWSSQLVSNIANYVLLTAVVKYSGLEFLTGGNGWKFLQDVLLHHIIPLLLSAYIEKGRRERWVLLDTFKKSETIFISLVESILIPVFVIDSNKRVLYANKHAQAILRKYFKNVTGRVPLHKMNVIFSSLLTHESQKILERLIINSALEQESQAKIVLKEAQEEQAQEVQPDAANPPSAWSTLLGTRLEELFQSSNNIYQVACTKILWKKTYANLLCIQDITKTLKVQEVMSSNFTKLIDEARTYMEAAGGNFENFTGSIVQNSNYKPLIQAISHMDKLRYSLQNTSMAYDIACGKFRIEMERFNIRDHIIYLLEVLSIQTIKQKMEMRLSFELSFPMMVTGDYLKFTQLLHNLFSTVIENCKDGIIKINCSMKGIDMDEGKYVLEFDIEFPKSSTLEFGTLRELINAEYQQDTAPNILKKDDFESKMLLFKPLLAVLNGTSSITDNGMTINVKIEAPFSTNPPSPSNRSQRRAEPIPSFNKFHLTNTRTSTGDNSYKWDAQPNIIPSPVISASKNDAMQCPSPLINSKISEKIKAQFTEGPVSGATKSLFGNPAKTPSYQAYKKQEKEKIRQNLLRFSGENLSGFSSEGSSSVAQSATPEPLEKPQRTDSHGLEEEPKAKAKKEEDQKEVENLVKIVKKKSNINDGMPHLLKSPGVVKALEMTKVKAQSSNSTEQTSQQPDSAVISKPAEIEKPVEEVQKEEKEMPQEKSQWEETKNTYKEAKARPGSCQIENQKMLTQINHKRSISIAEPSPIANNIVRVNTGNLRTPQQSLFSPASVMNRRSSEIGMPNKLLSKYLDTRKASIDSSDAGEFMFMSDLKSHEKLLKVAIGNVLIEIFTLYHKNPHSFYLHISKLDLDRSAAVEERISPAPSDLHDDQIKEEPSLVSLESENKDFALREIARTSFHSDKLNGDELLDRVMNYIFSKLTSTKSEKEFINFLINYVKMVERKLRGTVSVTPYGEEEKEFYDQLMSENNEMERMKRQRAGNAKLHKMGSSESIFSMGSDMSTGEKAINLTERILMSPAVTKMLTFKHNPAKMIQKVVEAIEEISGKGDKTKQEIQTKKKQRKYTVDTPEKAISTPEKIIDTPEKTKPKKKEDIEKELLPFDRPVSMLPLFITVRIEPQRRKWKGGAHTIYGKDKTSDFKYLENFTILAVDDSNFILDGLKLMPTPYKKQLEFAKDGLEAFTKFQSISKQGLLYHLILMDINMPKCGGIEATRMIRAYEKEHHCPSTFICGLSAFEGSTIKRDCFDAGMDDFCFKPLDPKKLTEFIETRCKALNIQLPLAEKS